MVVAKFEIDEEKKKLSLHVKGHAGANKAGNDIVCAGASTLAYTLAQTLKIEKERGNIKYNPTLKLKEGDAIISCRAISDEAFNALCYAYLVIQNGYVLLSHNYPQYVAVEMFGESDKD